MQDHEDRFQRQRRSLHCSSELWPWRNRWKTLFLFPRSKSRTKIQSGKKLVRVKGDDGKFITTKYDKLTDDQKSSVLKDLYDDATAATKINYWIKDLHNKYYTSNKNEYLDLYKKYGSSVKYVQGWNKSKFVK